MINLNLNIYPDLTNLVAVINTQVDNSESSQNRKSCVLQTMEAIKSAGMNAIVVDRVSSDGIFLRELQSYNSSLIHIISEDFQTYGEQVRYAFQQAVEIFPDSRQSFLRTEGEKSDIFSPENLSNISKFMKKNHEYEYISLMRRNYVEMPDSQSYTEALAANQINNAIDQILGCNNFSNCEGVGTFFGPVIASREGAERIINMSAQNKRDGNELLFVARIRSFLEGLDEGEQKALFLAVDFAYSNQFEIIPEQKEWEQYTKNNGGGDESRKHLVDIHNTSLDIYKEENPDNLLSKRRSNYIYILEAVKNEIIRYKKKL